MSELMRQYAVAVVDNDDNTAIVFTKAQDESYAEYQVNQEYPDRDVVAVSELPPTWRREPQND